MCYTKIWVAFMYLSEVVEVSGGSIKAPVQV